MTAIRIERGDRDEIELLRDLWLSLHHHHATVAPESGQFVGDDASWRARSASYREWLAEPASFLVLARQEDRIVGYAMVRVKAAAEWADTYVHPDDQAEIETLVVAAEHRGSGLGTGLFDAIEAELEARGISETLVGLIPGNDGAQRFYERRGFKPRWLVLARDPARNGAGSSSS